MCCRMKWTALLLACLTFFGCQKKELPRSTTIYVTVSPYDTLVQQIVGETAEVKTVVPPGADLHTFEPSPAEVRAMQNGALWITIGETIERTIPFKKRFPLAKSETEDHHYWMSPTIVKEQMREVTAELSRLFPNHLDLYEKNLANLEDQLFILQRELHAILDPISGATVVVNHPSLGYFCQEYDLIQLAIEDHGKEPQPGHLENLLKQAREERARCILVQNGTPEHGAKLIAKRLSLPLYPFNPNAPDYFKNLLSIARDIRKG